MKYDKILSGPYKEKIFNLFMENDSLKFSDIEKGIGSRSNKLAYYIKKLTNEGVLNKKSEYYSLSKDAEKYLPFFSNKIKGTLNPLPVVLLAIMHKNKVLLIKRKRRPYQNHWCMVGGKVLGEEIIHQSAKRLIKDKTSLNGNNPELAYIIHERVLEKSSVKHSFILFFMKINCKSPDFKSLTGEEMKWVEISKLKEKEIVPSDYWLLNNKLSNSMDLMLFDMDDRKGKLIRRKR